MTDRDKSLETFNRLEKIRGEIQRRQLNKVGVGRFTEFAPTVMGNLKLSPAQVVLSKIAFDGAQPSDLNEEELVLFNKIFGDVDHIPDDARSIFVSVCGARSGKSYLSALRLLHLALTVDLSTLAPGEQGLAVIIAPALHQAMHAMTYIIGAIQESAALTAMVVGKPTTTKIHLRRGGQVISIEPRAAVRAGVGGRGRSLLGVILDEAAFFRGEEFQVADKEIFAAVYARLVPGAQCLIPSTPWTQTGLLYEKYKENFSHPVTAMCAHAPTIVMLNTERNRLIIEQTHKEDPDRASLEYDAEFVSASIEAFFDPVWIEKSIDDSLNLGRYAQDGDIVKAGADFGFERDSSALAITHVSKGLHYLAEIVEKRVEKDQPLMPSEVVRKFAEVCQSHHTSSVMADPWYRMTIIEYLNEYGLFFIDAPHTPADAYITARILLHQGRIRFPRNARLLAQLKEVRARRLPTGKIQIIQPRTSAGGHGDLVSAWVLCVFQACGERIPEVEPEPGTAAYSAWVNDRLKEGRRVEQQRDFERRADSRFWKTSPSERIRNRLH